MTPEDRNRLRGILVRVSVALRTGLGHRETLEEVEEEIEELERAGAYTRLSGEEQ
jgi:hypothetical protein